VSPSVILILGILMLDDMLAGQIGEESRFNQEIDRGYLS
jgi:hypothetical protein